MKISVVGTGYVGLVAGVCFADTGHHVICVDNNPDKIDRLNKGEVPIYEPGLEDIMRPVQRSERIEFTTDLKYAVESTNVIFIAVGTPETASGDADLGPTYSVVDDICKSAQEDKFVVLKSTVPVGTAKEIQAYFDKNCDHKVEVINNPEFLKEGAAIEDFLKPDRVVIGCRTQDAENTMRELYAPFVKNGHPILFMDNTSAELTKYAANAFLSVKISFANELALLADKVGADINHVRKGFTSDARINPAFFYPGVGYGGSCFPKDVTALISTAGKNDLQMSVVKAADEVNDRQKTILFDYMIQHFGDLKGKTIAFWGLSFKPRTDDVREAPARYMIEKLTKAGAKVVAYDPVASKNAQAYFPDKFEVGSNAYSITEGADALAIITEWNEFRTPDFDRLKCNLKTPVIFDGRNVLNPKQVRGEGFTYFCIGRQSVQ